MVLREIRLKCWNTSHIVRATSLERKGFLKKECFSYPHTPQHSPSSQECSYCITSDYVDYRWQKCIPSHHKSKQGSKLGITAPVQRKNRYGAGLQLTEAKGSTYFYFSPSLETWPPTGSSSSMAATVRKSWGRILTGLVWVMWSLHPQLWARVGSALQMERRSVPRKMGARK